MEQYTPMTSERFLAPAVTCGNAAKERGTGLSAYARGTTTRAFATDGINPGLTVWSPPA